MIGIININKPPNLSSHKVVAKVRYLTGVKKVGHLGTLDPLAEGVLPISVGKATRLFDYFLGKTKTYEADFDFSYLTDTLDAEGKILKSDLKVPSIEEITAVLPNFTGKILQQPPQFSAKKIGGVRAYRLAREGKVFELKPSQIEIFKLEALKKVNDSTFRFLIDCSSGTYIRSLGRDIANRLNTESTMVRLIRTRVGNFNLSEALDFENISLEKIRNNILPLEKLNFAFEEFNLTDEEFKKIISGIAIKVDSEQTFIIKYKGQIVAIGKPNLGALKIDTNLRE